MADATIIITVGDRDPLLVSKQMLVESSSVFNYIIVECSQSEHDMTDFTTEIVELFLTLLEDKNLEQIEEADFRELHKISAVFNVEWLVNSCRQWLLERMNSVEVIDYESLSFLFEECHYIYGKWDLPKYMEALILEVRFKDTSLFLSRYIRENYDQLSTDQMKFLLHLAGSNTEVFLVVIIERINSQEYLDDRTRYLLHHMNLSLCVEQNHKLYHEMCGRFPEMTDMSNDDSRLLLMLTTEATRDVIDRKNSTATTATVYDINTWYSLYRECDSLSDITRLITEDRISSMYSVIDLLVTVTHDNTISTEEIEKFVEALENLSLNKPLQKVSTHYIDMWITALEFSNKDNKHQFINLLTKIRNSEKLASCYDNIRLEGEKITQSTVVNSLKYVLGLDNPDRYVFRMNHPGVTDCKIKGDCGFVITEVSEWTKYELSREAGDYSNSRVHVHDVIRAEHMYWYWILTGTTRGGDTVTVPDRGRWWWGWEWFSEVVTDWGITEHCVDYNIGDYLVAKY